MSKLSLERLWRISAGIVVLVVVTVGAYIVTKKLVLTEFQVLYAVASVFLITVVLLWGMGLWSMPLPRPESESEETPKTPPERSKNNASAD